MDVEHYTSVQILDCFLLDAINVYIVFYQFPSNVNSLGKQVALGKKAKHRKTIKSDVNIHDAVLVNIETL